MKARSLRTIMLALALIIVFCACTNTDAGTDTTAPEELTAAQIADGSNGTCVSTAWC